MSEEPELPKISPEEAEDVAIFSRKIQKDFLTKFIPDSTFLLSLEESNIANPYAPGFITRLQLQKVRGFNYANAILREDSLDGFSKYAIQDKDVWVFAVTDSERTRKFVTQTLYSKHKARSVYYVVRYPNIKIYESGN